MRKNLIIVSLLFIGMFTACAQSKKTTKSHSTKKAITSTKSAVNITSLTMRRSGCYGKCPEYSITINSNGMAKYTGGRNAELQGVFEKNIGAENAQKLLQECANDRIDTCADMYKVRFVDLPGLHFTFTINGKEKRVMNAHAGPSYFITISEEVDRLGMPDGSWTKGGIKN